VAEVHDGLAGGGQILLGHFINPPAPAQDQSGAVELSEMFGGVVVAAAGDLGQFGNGARFAGAQFLEHLPTVPVAQCGDEPVNVRALGRSGGWRGFDGRVHGKKGNLAGKWRQVGK